jgi:hypothetical protein
MTEPVPAGVHEVKPERRVRWRYRAVLRICCLPMLGMLLPLSALAGDISGSYVGEGRSFVVQPQIFPVDQGQVIG